ncbi:MAG: hypothetical protein IJA38_05980, partial [Bacteroidales bacterium]|nr:hypothetical protein [Bacteroidales bacterium]
MGTGKKILKWAAIALSCVATIIIIAAIAIKITLTPENLNKMVSQFSNEFLNAQVKTDTIELHIFRHFPRITLSIKNGEIVSNALAPLRADSTCSIPTAADTLLKFKSFNVSLSLIGLLNSDVRIRRASIVSPKIYAYIAPDSTANFDIFKVAEDETEEVEEDEGSPMSVSMNSISIKDGANVIYNSAPDSLLATLSLNRFNLRGNLSSNLKQLIFNRAVISGFSIDVDKAATLNDTLHNASARFSLDSLDISNRKNGNFTIAAATRTDLRMNQAVLVKDFPVEINGAIIFDTTQTMRGKLQEMTVSVAKIPVVFNGIFDITPDSLYTENICGRIENMSIREIMKYIPEHIFNATDKIETNATITLDVDVNGSYNFKTGQLPSITAMLDIPNSYVEFEGRESRINELETHIKAYYTPHNADSSAIEINKFVVNGRGIQLALNGKISDIASSDPYLNLLFKAGTNLDTLSTLFPAKEGSMFSGTVGADLSVKSRMSNLDIYKLGNADIKGELVTEKIKVVVPSQQLYAILSGIKIKAGSTVNTHDASIKKGMKMLATLSTADSIYFKYKDEHMVAATMLQLAGHHTAEGLNQDTLNRKVLPVNGTISAQRLYVRGVDSAAVNMRDPKIKFSILPYKDNYKIPVLNVSTRTSRLMARDLTN